MVIVNNINLCTHFIGQAMTQCTSTGGSSTTAKTSWLQHRTGHDMVRTAEKLAEAVILPFLHWTSKQEAVSATTTIATTITATTTSAGHAASALHLSSTGAGSVLPSLPRACRPPHHQRLSRSLSRRCTLHAPEHCHHLWPKTRLPGSLLH
jgi:hypothetical protein